MRGPAEKPLPIALIDALLKCAATGVPDAAIVAIAGLLANGNWQLFGQLARWIENAQGRQQLAEARRWAWAVPPPAEIPIDQAAAAALSEGS